MRVVSPYIPKKLRGPGVYMMTIDDKWIYIGSSHNLYNRFLNWRHKLKAGTYRNRNIRIVLKSSSKVVFEILEHTGDNFKDQETIWISKHFNDECCLNMCPNSDNCKGRRMPMGYKYKVRPVKGVRVEARPVARFDMNWNYIDQTRTITEMAALLGCRKPSDFTARISSVANGKAEYYKGYKFKFVNPDGSFQDVTLKLKGPRTYKTVLQVNSNHEVVGKFNGIADASKKTGSSRSQIAKVIYGQEWRKTTGGYKYEYADQYQQ